MQHHARARRDEVVGDQGRLADAEVDVGAGRDVAGDQPRPSRSLATASCDASAHTVHHPVDVDARGHHGLRVELTDSTTSRDLDDDGGRGGGHHRTEVAGGLAVDEVAHPVGAVGADQGDVAADRVLEHVGAPVDLAGLLALGQRRADAGRAEERADPGAGRAHPLGEVALRHQLQLDPAGAVEAVEDPGVLLARERADHLAHPPLGQQRGQARVAVAGVVVDTRSGRRRPGRISASISSTGMPASPKPPISTVAPSATSATASRRRRRRRTPASHDACPVTGSVTFSRTTARAWPTPMQIAATPHRSPGLAQPVGQRAEDPAAGGTERVADRDRAALGVDDLGVDLPRVHAGQRLHGERLVELDRRHVGPARSRRGRAPVSAASTGAKPKS